MDLLDKKILYYLYDNPSMPVTVLAKKVRAAKSVAAYRLAKLKEGGILYRTRYIFDLNSLGFMPLKNLFLQFTGISQKEFKEILVFLGSHVLVESVSSTLGNYDLIVSLLCKNQIEFFFFLEEFNNKYGVFCRSKVFFDTIYSEAFMSKIFMKNLQIKKKIIHDFNKFKKKVDLDDTDIKIIRMLRKDARISYRNIAKIIHATPEAARYRIKKISRSDIVLGKDLFIDLQKLGLNLVYVYFSLFSSEKSTVSSIREYCYNTDRIIAFSRYLGKHDACISLFVSNYAELQQSWVDFREKFGKFISEYEILPVILFKKKARDI